MADDGRSYYARYYGDLLVLADLLRDSPERAWLTNVPGEAPDKELVLYLGCALAAWRLRTGATSRSRGDGFQIPFGGLIPVLTCLVIAWLMTGITGGEWLALTICLAVVSLVYAVAGRRRVTV